MRQRIVALLQAHPGGLTAVEIKVPLHMDKNIGNTLAGMVRDQVLAKQGSGAQVRYRAARPSEPPARLPTPAPAPRRGAIAVGRPVTRPPPHRSRRAELPHRALRSDSLSHAAYLQEPASLPRGFSVRRGRSILK